MSDGKNEAVFLRLDKPVNEMTDDTKLRAMAGEMFDALTEQRREAADNE